jgi:capping protein beta
VLCICPTSSVLTSAKGSLPCLSRDTDLAYVISDLLRRLPPNATSANLTRLCTIAPQLTEDLLSSVDQPLDVRRCKKTGRDYLLCDYNRDGDSWRSPWSNEFEPPIEDDDDGVKPSERVRALEVRMGEGMDIYREL